MLRRARRLLVLLAVLVVIVAAVAVVLGSRPALDHARTRIDDRWTALRAPLDARYRALAPVAVALGAELGADHGLPHDLSTALARWNTLGRGKDAGAQVDTANELEGLASRATATAQSSDKLRGDAGLQRAVQAFAATSLPRTDVDAYDSAVRTYQHLRTSGVRRLTASLFAYGPRRTLEAVTPAGA
jgi:hypothetical protein